MAARARTGKISAPLGEVIEVPDPAEITLPSGEVRIVVGGRYAIDVEGAHTVKAG